MSYPKESWKHVGAAVECGSEVSKLLHALVEEISTTACGDPKVTDRLANQLAGLSNELHHSKEEDVVVREGLARLLDNLSWLIIHSNNARKITTSSVDGK